MQISQEIKIVWCARAISASEIDRFATIIKDMAKENKKLDPSPSRAGG